MICKFADIKTYALTENATSPAIYIQWLVPFGQGEHKGNSSGFPSFPTQVTFFFLSEDFTSQKLFLHFVFFSFQYPSSCLTDLAERLTCEQKEYLPSHELQNDCRAAHPFFSAATSHVLGGENQTSLLDNWFVHCIWLLETIAHSIEIINHHKHIW